MKNNIGDPAFFFAFRMRSNYYIASLSGAGLIVRCMKKRLILMVVMRGDSVDEYHHPR